MYLVYHRPDVANPKELPWCVSRHGNPIRWFRQQVFAEIYSLGMNRTGDDSEAMKLVKESPDDLGQAEFYLETLRGVKGELHA